jgi:hypothetical protein
MEAHVEAWLILGLLSVAIGVLVAKVVKNPLAVLIAAAIAWCGLLGWLLYYEYFVPYQGGGASMWPIGQMFGGTFVAIVAGSTAAIVVAMTPKRKPAEPSDKTDTKLPT